MLCSHRLPYEQRCPFCFEAAMEVERLRLDYTTRPALLRNGPTASGRSMRSRNCRSGNERRRMGRGSVAASGCSDRRRAGGLDKKGNAPFSGLA